MFTLLSLTLLAARPRPPAPESSLVDPALPIASAPWEAVVTAYALPPQKPAYIVDESPIHTCDLSVHLQLDGSFTTEAGACPAPMVAEAQAAAALWRFAPVNVDVSQGQTVLGLRFVVSYSETLGSMSLHAEIDPGGANTALEGKPGLKLVHAAATPSPIVVKLSKKQKKAGVAPAVCTARVAVSAGGKVQKVELLECPDNFASDAVKRINVARWIPRTVDGMSYDDVVPSAVSYVP